MKMFNIQVPIITVGSGYLTPNHKGCRERIHPDPAFGLRP